MHVIFDRQHYGKPGRNDMGVAVDQDANGTAETSEALLTPDYIDAARRILEAHQHKVTVLDYGWYPDRHALAVQIARDAAATEDCLVAYVACHLNAGGGDYGLVLHDSRSKAGERLAAAVSEALWAELGRRGLAEVHVRAASSSPPWSNAFNTIKGIYQGPDWLCGICFEPVFVDTHRALLTRTGLEQIGGALARGILSWREAERDTRRAPEPVLYQDGVARALVAHDACRDPQAGDTVAPAPDVALREVLDRDETVVIWRPWPFGGTQVRSSLAEWRADCARGVMIEATTRSGRPEVHGRDQARPTSHGHDLHLPQPIPARENTAAPTGQWRVLGFLAGENNLSDAAGRDIAEMETVGSTDSVHVIVQIDNLSDSNGSTGSARRYLIKKNDSAGRRGSRLLLDLGKTNCGDPQVIKSFLADSIENYPADRTMLVLWNHGSGFHVPQGWHSTDRGLTNGELVGAARRSLSRHMFSTAQREILSLDSASRGICYDDGSGDCLDNRELLEVMSYATSLLNGQKVDILGMDACLMTMIEVAWQVKDYAKYLVGSEESEPNAGWPYHTILRDLVADPKMSDEKLVKTIVHRYMAACREAYPASALTQSAIDLGKLDELHVALRTLADALLACADDRTIRNCVKAARLDTTDFYGGLYADIHDLVTNLEAQIDDRGIRTACGRVKSVISGADTPIIAEDHAGPGMDRVTGLSIYWPIRDNVARYYEGLLFAQSTGWGKMLEAYVPTRNW